MKEVVVGAAVWGVARCVLTAVPTDALSQADAGRCRRPERPIFQFA